MALEFSCPHCGGTITEGVRSLGEVTTCPHCNQECEIPTDPHAVTHIADAVGDSIGRVDSTGAANGKPPLPGYLKMVLFTNAVLVIIFGAGALLYFFRSPFSLTMLFYHMFLLMYHVSLLYLLLMMARRRLWSWYAFFALSILNLLGIVISLPFETVFAFVFATLLNLTILFLIFTSERQYLD